MQAAVRGADVASAAHVPMAGSTHRAGRLPDAATARAVGLRRPTASRRPSAADRLRDDPLETAPVPSKPLAAPAPPVKLDERPARGCPSHHADLWRRSRLDRADRALRLQVGTRVPARSPPDPCSDGRRIGLRCQCEEPRRRQRADAGSRQGAQRPVRAVGGTQAVYDPPANIKVGAGILSEYVTRYGDVAAGLKAYVGAALLPTDRGYGSKVLNRQAEFDCRASGRMRTDP